MSIMLSDAVGFAAAASTTLSFVPQVLKVWRTRSAADISIGMYVWFTLGVLLWLLYGLLIHAWPVVIANALTTLLTASVLAMKLRFDLGRRS